MEQVKDVLGEYLIPMTVGEASGSIPLLVAESTAIKNASTNVKSMYLAKQAEGNQAVRDYVNEVYGDVHYFGDTTENVIIAANDALASNGKIAVAQTADGVIHFTPRASRNMNGDIVSDAPPGFGIDVEIKGAQNSAWQVKGSNLKNETTDLTNTGIGGQMYYHAMKEAQMHGGHLVSDSTVSGAASRVWENLGEESSNTIIKRHKDAVWDKDTKSWSVQSGEPVYEVVQKKSYTEALLDAYKPTTRATKPRLNTATGEVTPGSKVRTAEHFDRHLHNPGQEVANMRDDIAINPYVKQRYKEMVLDNYRTHTTDPKTGKVDGDKVTEWLDSTRTNLYNVFTKEEMFAINKGQLPSTVEATRASLDQMDGAINRIIDIDLGNLVKDGGLLEQASKKDMVSQMRALEPVEVRRLFKMLDNVPGVDRGVMGDHIRAMVQDDIRMELLQKVGGQNYLGMDKWMKSNEDLLHSIYPGRAGEVMMHLRMVRNTIKRNYDVAQVTGTAADQNPTGLALTRVIFGPLSRAQRFFSAARRGQVRGGAAKASELILDPDALRLFARIRSSDIESRVVAKAVQDMGGWDLFPVDINKWIPMAPDGSGGEEFDSNNPSHRKAIAGYVGHLLALENDWNAQNK
jgi:hypothetical protein